MKYAKISLRFYTVADYEAEETFLRKQHRKGYKFVKFIYPGFYCFEACESEDVIYRLDFYETARNDCDAYLQLYQDCGWEYFKKVNSWNYFRKAAQRCDLDGSDAIFSDHASKLQLLERVYKSRILP